MSDDAMGDADPMWVEVPADDKPYELHDTTDGPGFSFQLTEPINETLQAWLAVWCEANPLNPSEVAVHAPIEIRDYEITAHYLLRDGNGMLQIDESTNQPKTAVRKVAYLVRMFDGGPAAPFHTLPDGRVLMRAQMPTAEQAAEARGREFW